MKLIKIRKKEHSQSRRNKILQNKLNKKKRRKSKRKGNFSNQTKFNEENQRKLNKKLRLGFRYAEHVQTFVAKNMMLIKKGTRATLKLNTSFSIFNNSEFVLEKLTTILWHAKTYVHPPIIKYENHISFGAIHLLDHLCWEIGKKRKWQVKFSHLSPREQAIISNLKTIESTEIENQYEYLVNERIKINRSTQDDAPQGYLVKGTQITTMIERAIKAYKKDDSYSLPIYIHEAIKSSIGEQFDNILLHSKEADFGVLCGFYDKENKEVTLLIYNFGKTIAQTLMEKFISQSDENPSPQKVKIGNFIDTVIDNHLKKGFFERSHSFTAETALTLLAIQEGVSTEIDKDITRGHGLMDFIEHCFNLTQNCKISILSGNTAIRIDKKYKISEKEIMGVNRRVLAFNDKNDIFEKPDRNSVINNKYAFNGVLIETIIPLDDLG